MRVSREKIELLMARKGLNNTKFAENCGISRQNISTIKMRGTCKPDTAAKMANGLGVDVTEILEG